jgi:hypothetical protein
VEEAGEPEHGVDVALVREREQEHVLAAPTVDSVATCGAAKVGAGGGVMAFAARALVPLRVKR